MSVEVKVKLSGLEDGTEAITKACGPGIIASILDWGAIRFLDLEVEEVGYANV